MLRHAGWTSIESRNYLVVPVSSRDEDRHTLYLAQVMDDGLMQPIDSRDLAAPSCDEGVEAVRTFVKTTTAVGQATPQYKPMVALQLMVPLW